MRPPRELRTMKNAWLLIMLTLLLASSALAAPQIIGSSDQRSATISAEQLGQTTRVVLQAQGIGEEPVTVTLQTSTGETYLLPAQQTSTTTWQATFPVAPASAEITARQGVAIVASTSIGEETQQEILPEEQLQQRGRTTTIISKATIKDHKGKALEADISLTKGTKVSTDLPLQLPKGKYNITITPHDQPVRSIDFNNLEMEEQVDIGIQELHDEKYLQSYAIDPTRLNFTNATVTVTAKGTKLYKCAEWNYTEQTCYGEWELYKTGLVPGETYTFTLTPLDPAFGETDPQSEPDTCTFSDQAGQGDGDNNADCLTEITTQNSGFTADLDDLETFGAPNQAQLEANFINNLYVTTVNNINVTIRYQRQTNTLVGPTTAYIQVLDNAAYTTACTDTISIGTWEEYTCDLSTWVSTEAEINNISIRIITDTDSSGQPKQEGRTFIDHIYLSANYDERDVTPPTYSGVIATPSSPTTYNGAPAWFNITWNDDFNISNVLIEHNFTGTLQNETMNNLSSEYYYTATLGADTYVWRSYANDTSGNTNKTTQYTYNINKATPTLTLAFNGTQNNITINDSELINITGSGGEGTLELLREGTLLVSATGTVSTNELFNTIGIHNITLRHNETQNYTARNVTYTVTVVDTIPPGTVTNLANISRGETWIYWNWTNPTDSDYSHTEIWLNNTFKINTTQENYNATALNAQTTYEIQLRTVDANDNKATYTNDTAKTIISTDTTPPVINNLQHTDITATTANISWTTDELAGCLIEWGTSSGVYTQSTSCAENKLAQSIILNSLQPTTDYYYIVTAIDVADNNATAPERSFTTAADTNEPTYSDITTNPSSPSSYSPSLNTFTVTWTDDVGVSSVVIEHNLTGSLRNDTMSASGNDYTYGRVVDAGTYTWKSYATDGSNTNKTPTQTYIVNKETPTTHLYIDGVENNNTINEDETITVSGTINTPSTGYLRLYYEGALVSQGYSSIGYTNQYLYPGNYNFTLEFSETNNYLEQKTTYWLNVIDTVAPNVTLNSPSEGHNDTDGVVQFTYNVQDHGTLDNCSLLLDGSIEQTDNTPTIGNNQFTKEDFTDGTYNWNIECYDTAGNQATGTQRTLIIDKQTITINVTATSTSNWDDADTILISTINAADGSVESRTIARDTTRTITQTNYSTANIPPGAVITDADFYAYHQGTSNKITFEGVNWYDGNDYLQTGCAPILQTGVYRTDTCDIGYIDTVEEANNITLQYVASAGSAGTISIDHLYMTITYIKETTPPVFTNIQNVTLDTGVALAQQYNATDLYGIANWTINDTTTFSITNTGLLTNTTPLSTGNYKILIRASDPSNNYAEENITITVANIATINITLDTTGIETSIIIYNSTGGLISTGTNSLDESLLQNELYDIAFATTLTSGKLTTTLRGVNLSKNINYESDITETYSATLPQHITSISPLYAINDEGTNFSYATIDIPKAGEQIDYILHCTDWNTTTDECGAWEVNETTDYDYAENETHFTINVSVFDAYGGGPGDTLANVTEIRIYDVTQEANNRTGGVLVNNGTNTTFTLLKDHLYRAEMHITNEALKWNIATDDIAKHEGLNESWNVNAGDIWYSIEGINYTGGTFTSGTVAWDLSAGGSLGAQANGTWNYVFNTTSNPTKDYSVTFTVNDTSKNSGSTDQSTYAHEHERELIVNQSSLTFNNTEPKENENVSVTITIYNQGIYNATDFTIELWDATINTLLYTETINVTAQSSTTTNYNYTAQTGSHLIELRADTSLTTNGTIQETYEDNNNYATYLNTSAWYTLYGEVTKILTLAGIDNTFYTWKGEQATGYIYAADADANIDFTALTALGRNTTGAATSDDFTQADTVLNLTGYPDSLSERYANGGNNPHTTTSETLNDSLVSDIPIINSTNNANFYTGVLWDASDDTNGEYDDTENEDLIFFTKINPNTTGAYGTYDYELTMPSALQKQKGTTDTIYLYKEIT